MDQPRDPKRRPQDGLPNASHHSNTGRRPQIPGQRDPHSVAPQAPNARPVRPNGPAERPAGPNTNPNRPLRRPEQPPVRPNGPAAAQRPQGPQPRPTQHPLGAAPNTPQAPRGPQPRDPHAPVRRGPATPPPRTPGNYPERPVPPMGARPSDTARRPVMGNNGRIANGAVPGTTLHSPDDRYPSPLRKAGTERPLTEGPGRSLVPVDDQKKKKKKKGKTPKAVLVLLDLVILTLFAFAIYLFVHPIILNKQQEAIKEQVLEEQDQRHAPASITIKKGEYALEGEQTDDGYQFANDPNYNPDDKIELKYFGQLIIPKLSVKSPISDVCDNYHLRFGVAMVPDASVPLGEDGQASFLGHRFLTKGRDFYDLDKLTGGELIRINDFTRHMAFFYKVDHQEIVNQNEYYDRIYANVPGNKTRLPGHSIVLATCHPRDFILATNANSQRLLIYARFERSVPLDKDGKTPDESKGK